MVNTLYTDVSFRHLVLCQREETISIVGCTQDGNIRIFLALENGNGQVYSRKNCEENWEELGAGAAHYIRNRIRWAYKRIPTHILN